MIEGVCKVGRFGGSSCCSNTSSTDGTFVSMKDVLLALRIQFNVSIAIAILPM
jgi:hypothetical protein